MLRRILMATSLERTWDSMGQLLASLLGRPIGIATRDGRCRRGWRRRLEEMRLAGEGPRRVLPRTVIDINLGEMKSPAGLASSLTRSSSPVMKGCGGVGCGRW